MNATERAEFVTLIVGLHESYRQDLTTAQLTLWAEVMADVTLADVKHAVVAWMRSQETFAPRAGQLRKMALAIASRRRELATRRNRAMVSPQFQRVKALQREQAPVEQIEKAIEDLDTAEAMMKRTLTSF